jgi:hypothetical protein
MLSAMSGCAYRLGMVFGDEAERADDPGRRLELFQLFDRCFFSVRVATALKLRLRREPMRAPSRDADGLGDREILAEPEGPAPENLDGERPDRERYDADREREREPVTLPILLRTLSRVADDAAALAGPPAAELPALRELLARATGGAAPATRSRPEARPSVSRPTGTLRARLAGSATTTILPPPKASGLETRSATGPPRG